MTQDYSTILDHGFLPTDAYVRELPEPYAAWHVLASSLPSLIAEGNLASAVNQLELLDTDGLPDTNLEAAKLALAFITQAYVWEPDFSNTGQPNTLVPASLAVPLVEVSRRLGEPAIFNYADHTLRNWAPKIESHGFNLESLDTVYSFTDRPDEKYFVLVHVVYEALGPDVVKSVEAAIDASEKEDVLSLRASLSTIGELLGDMRDRFLDVRRSVSPDVFRDYIRVFLKGWKNILNVRYDGCDIDAKELRGETGAESALLPLIDIALESIPQSNQSSSFRRPEYRLACNIYREFADYRPRLHRQYLSYIGDKTRIRSAVLGSRDSTITDLYNDVLNGIAMLRKAHLDTIHEYIQGEVSRADEYGTGGSFYEKYLEALIDITQGQRI